MTEPDRATRIVYVLIQALAVAAAIALGVGVVVWLDGNLVR